MRAKLFAVACTVFLVLTSNFLTGQVITTYAGGGSSFCENCPATATSITDPSVGIFNKTGECIFTSGLGGNRVRKVNALGIVNTIIGNGTNGFSGDGGIATSAQLHAPGSVALDALGNIYVADVQNFRIRKVDIHTNIISTIAGVGVMGYNGDEIPATTARFMPSHIIIDDNDNIIIADYNARRVRKIDTLGIIHTIAGKGTVGYSGDGGPATAAELSPSCLTMDNVGNLYISDPYANVVRKIDLTGIITTVAGNGSWIYSGDNIPATVAQIQPTCIVFDESNNLYISDNFNKRVFRVNASGIIHCVAGNGIAASSGDGGPATAASFDNHIRQLSVDSCGNLYVSEISGRIRKVTFNPPPCTYLSVNEQSVKKEVSIYPNPANEELHITSPGLSQGEVVLCNMLGQAVLSQQLNGKQTTINIKHLPPGLYLLALTDEEGKRTVYKIVKE